MFSVSISVRCIWCQTYLSFQMWITFSKNTAFLLPCTSSSKFLWCSSRDIHSILNIWACWNESYTQKDKHGLLLNLRRKGNNGTSAAVVCIVTHDSTIKYTICFYFNKISIFLPSPYTGNEGHWNVDCFKGYEMHWRGFAMKGQRYDCRLPDPCRRHCSQTL